MGDDVVAKAMGAADRVDDWDGSGHWEDCPAIAHETHECACVDTYKGQELCEDLQESECDCYLGALRDCQASIRALLERVR